MEKQVPFLERFTYEERIAESKKIKNKYRMSAPIIVEPKDNKTKRIDKTKFLVPWDLTYSQFLYVVRKRLSVDSSESIFMFCNNSLPKNQDTMHSLYQKHGNADGFLYFVYAFENTFG